MTLKVRFFALMVAFAGGLIAVAGNSQAEPGGKGGDKKDPAVTETESAGKEGPGGRGGRSGRKRGGEFRAKEKGESGDKGKGGRGGFAGRGGFPKPGQVLSPFLQDRLQLTEEQKKQVEDLQKDVDSKLGKILTDDQRKSLKDMQERVGRFGGPRGGGPRGRPEINKDGDKKGPPAEDKKGSRPVDKT